MESGLARQLRSEAASAGKTASRILEDILGRHFRDAMIQVSEFTLRFGDQSIRIAARVPVAGQNEFQFHLTGGGLEMLRQRMGDEVLAAVLFNGLRVNGLHNTVQELLANLVNEEYAETETRLTVSRPEDEPSGKRERKPSAKAIPKGRNEAKKQLLAPSV